MDIIKVFMSTPVFGMNFDATAKDAAKKWKINL